MIFKGRALANQWDGNICIMSATWLFWEVLSYVACSRFKEVGFEPQVTQLS